MRSAPELASLTEFCEKYPDLRFWQALSLWVNEAYDLRSPISLVHLDEEDPFYWEWEGPRPIGPGRSEDKVPVVYSR